MNTLSKEKQAKNVLITFPKEDFKIFGKQMIQECVKQRNKEIQYPHPYVSMDSAT